MIKRVLKHAVWASFNRICRRQRLLILIYNITVVKLFLQVLSLSKNIFDEYTYHSLNHLRSSFTGIIYACKCFYIQIKIYLHQNSKT